MPKFLPTFPGSAVDLPCDLRQAIRLLQARVLVYKMSLRLRLTWQ